MGGLRIEVNRLPTELVDTGFKTHPRARGAFFKHHRQHPVRQRLVRNVIFEAVLEDFCALEQMPVFIACEILHLQKMSHDSKTAVTRPPALAAQETP